MQIQLKQAEIVVALKDYISKKGIDLSGKVVDITFTASRKDAGLMADLSIEDLGIPAFTAEEADHAHATAAVVSLVKTPAPEVVQSVAAEVALTGDMIPEKVDGSTIVGAVANTAIVDGVGSAPVVADKPKSLFN
jgi:GTP cyclohydrolase FolE2